MKKDIAVIFGLFLVIALLVIFGKGFTSVGLLSQNGQVQTRKESTDVQTGTLTVKSKIADTPDERKKGLSGLNSLALNEGILFVFENPGDYGIWMKDMKFSIDILWIGEDKRIMAIAINVPPEPGMKDKDLAVYKPDGLAKYVLEINAGLVNLNNIRVGDEVKFSI